MPERDEIVRYLNERLNLAGIEDYSANGLQVQGGEHVEKIGLATDAALAVYREAVGKGCQMIVAHHGIIWGGGIKRVVGRDFDHLQFLIENQLSLYAAHLPLDMHPEFGNSVGMARLLGLRDLGPFGFHHGAAIGYSGFLVKPASLKEIGDVFKKELGANLVSLAFGSKKIKSVAVVSGSGSSTLPEAISKKIDCFVTGEGRHEDHHLALEGKINVLYVGHYQSETLGVKAVGKELAKKFGVEVFFLDVPTVV